MTPKRSIPILPLDDANRRRVLKLMAASAALGGSACSGPPAERILPYVRMPEGTVPGQPQFYASAFVRRGFAHGVLVEANEGRPTKIEGNPEHPGSGGASDVFMQASVLQLWDPDRSQAVFQNTEFGSQPGTWAGFARALDERRAAFARDGGAGLRILTGDVTSPTLAAQLRALTALYPNARWHAWEPLHDDGAAAAAQLAFGRAADTLYRLDRAQMVLALDADLLGDWPDALRNARDFTAGRRAGAAPGSGRLYAMEASASITGAFADERLARAPREIERSLWRIAARLGAVPDPGAAPDAATARWERAVATALAANRGRCVVAAGPSLRPAARALAHRLNDVLGNTGVTLLHVAPVSSAAPQHGAAIADLARDMHTGAVDTLLVLGANPVYTAPADLDFGQAMRRVKLSAHLGLYRDETAHQATWHLPQTHCYEMWSDARAHDGTASIVQPVIAPLYGGRSEHALLAMLLGREGAGAGAEAYAAVRRTWAEHTDGDAGLSVNGREDADANRRQRPGVDGGRAAPTILGAATAVAGGGAADPRFDARFEGFWQEALRRGVIDGSAAPPLALKASGEIGPPPARLDAIEIVFKPDPGLDGGEFANNAWLQEWPRPLTQLTWDNAALLGPGTAAALKLIDGERLRIEVAGRALEAPVLVLPEQADGVVTLPLGYGRTAAGNVGNGVGFNAYRLRSLAALGAPAAGKLTRAAGFHTFALRQKEDDMHGRSIVRLADLQEFTRKPAFANALERDRVPEHSLYPQVPYKEHKWGMAIDLNACIGCGTCTLACQAENNIPTVGKEEVLRGRIMHWIRVDRYRDRDTGRKGAGGRARTLFQPVPCMHCEQAPCEEVCPVGATVHDSEGLNVQVYNRCVGTRFCSNNCPYKVRRFNFLQYADASREQIKASRNPEVTVRRRGVMEKCTFCLQRITRARIDAEKLGRGIQDGEVVTACQAACPTSAIVFGDLNDKSSAVVRAKASPLDYALLAELNTRPRTTYAARVVNPDPELE